MGPASLNVTDCSDTAQHFTDWAFFFFKQLHTGVLSRLFDTKIKMEQPDEVNMMT